VQRLEDGSDGLVVFTAPAGYGKTTVVQQWLFSHDRRAAMVTFGPGDDPPRVAARLFVALATLGIDHPGWTADVLSGRASGGGPLLDELIAEFARVGEATLVVDGIDGPVDQRAIAELNNFVERAPANLGLVVTRRSREVAAFSRSHQRGPLVTFDTRQLAFTDDEVRELVRAVAGVELSSTQLERLLTTTEGWAAGLQLAAVGLRSASDLDAFLDGFAVDDPYVARYIEEEVLAGQPTDVRRFLRHTSVLDRLPPALCGQLTGDPNPETMLRRLERRGVFTHRLTRSGGSFTYHPLFRSALRTELRRNDPGTERELLAKAGRWHARHREPELAARCLIDSEDFDQLLDLIDRFGQVMFQRGQVRDLVEWLDAVPSGNGPRYREVALRRSYLQTMVGAVGQATQTLDAIDADDASPGERLAMDALRASWAYHDGSAARAIEAADAVLDGIAGAHPLQIPDVFGLTAPKDLVVLAAGSRGRALWYLGDVSASREALLRIVRQPAVYPVWRTHVLSALALLEAWSGNLRAARVYIFRALGLAGRNDLMHHPAVLDARLAGAHISRERGNITRAFGLLDEAKAITDRVGLRAPWPLFIADRALAHLSRGEPDLGLDVIDDHRHTTDDVRPPLLDQYMRAAEARLALAVGDIDRAETAIRPGEDSRLVPELAAASVQSAVMRRDYSAARARLSGWVVDDAIPRHRLERDLWAAIVDFDTRNQRHAVLQASVVARAAAREGHVRLFLDAGQAAHRLLDSLARSAPTPFIERLAHDAETSDDTANAPLLGLSKRELEVVRYLPTPLSNAEIASCLYVSLNTLKTHLRTIYRKLGVEDRRGAVRRAEELGIA
jgi:LuxR family maltose regulon positive regulatory protein